jgi:hypothetical protein
VTAPRHSLNCDTVLTASDVLAGITSKPCNCGAEEDARCLREYGISSAELERRIKDIVEGHGVPHAEVMQQLRATLSSALLQDPAVLAERYYRLVFRYAAGHGSTVVPWDKLPAAHRAVLVGAAGALLRGET